MIIYLTRGANAFIESYNQLDNGYLLDDIEMMKEVASDTTEIDASMEETENELYYAIEVAKQMVDENAATAMDQEEYLKRYKTVEDKINTLNKKIDDLKSQKKRKLALVGRLCLLEDSINNKEGTLSTFDEKLWNILIEKVLVKRNQTLEFIYYAGFKNEITL